MALPTSKVDDEQEEHWVDLEAILLARTIHLHSLSPFHLPLSSLSSSSSKGITNGIRKIDLKLFSQQLQSHLSSRLNQKLFATTAQTGGDTRTGSTSNVIQSVRASFIDRPELNSLNTPKPFVVEIQVNQPSPTPNDPDRKVVEFAHLLVLSTPHRATPSHYPILLWKAPPSGRPAPLDGAQASGDNGMDTLPPIVTSRLLTSQTLFFLTAYFDCRLSTLAPLHGIRGKSLELLAEKILIQARNQSKQFAMELTFALPSQIPGSNGESVDGPSPDLNTISLSVPGPIAEELMEGVAYDTTILPAIYHYLSSHTSIQLSRLTLTRVGIANVYLGAPTSTMASGEVRLKISRDADGQSQEDIILTVLQQLIRIAGEEEW